MTFRASVLSLRDGRAMRTDTMRGYIKCEEIAKAGEETWTRKFNMIFVENEGDLDGDSASSYAFVVEIHSDVVKVVSAPTPGLTIDTQLMELLLSEDWFVGDTEDFEEFRTSDTSRW